MIKFALLRAVAIRFCQSSIASAALELKFGGRGLLKITLVMVDEHHRICVPVDCAG
jgi:hypothetical protein